MYGQDGVSLSLLDSTISMIAKSRIEFNLCHIQSGL